MKITLDIQDSKAAAFLHFIQSLDFVTVRKQEGKLDMSDEQKEAIDHGLTQVKKGQVLDHNSAMEVMKKRHPKHFK